MQYCAINLDSTVEYPPGESPVDKALEQLASGGQFDGKVDLHVIDAPYGLKKADWDQASWKKDDFIAVLKVRWL